MLLTCPGVLPSSASRLRASVVNRIRFGLSVVFRIRFSFGVSDHSDPATDDHFTTGHFWGGAGRRRRLLRFAGDAVWQIGWRWPRFTQYRPCDHEAGRYRRIARESPDHLAKVLLQAAAEADSITCKLLAHAERQNDCARTMGTTC